MAALKDRIEPLLQEWSPVMREAFLKAFRTLRNRAEMSRLVAQIKAGDVEGAVAAIGLDPLVFRPVAAALERTFEEGGIDATAGIRTVRGPLGIRVTPMFDPRAPAAEAWVRQHSDDLIKQITEDQRTLIRAAMAPLWSGDDPMLTGQTPQKIALDLVGRISAVTGNREGGVLGLTSQQAQWARNYAVELGDAQAGVVPDAGALTRTFRDRRFDRTVRRAIKEGTPLPADARRAMVANYRNKALIYRAEMVSKHEALTALHQSQLEAWDQAIARGATTADGVRRYWVTMGDERVRETHAEIPGMNAEGRGLREPFQTPEGEFMNPPIAPNCRCRVRIRVLE